MKQIPLPIGPLPEPRFDNFVPGANAAALQHLQALVCPSAPIYLWGPAGSGKSHLLRALAELFDAVSTHFQTERLKEATDSATPPDADPAKK